MVLLISLSSHHTQLNMKFIIRGIEAGEMIFNYQKNGNEIEITVETKGNYLAKLIGRDKEIQKLKIKYKNSKPYPYIMSTKKLGKK